MSHAAHVAVNRDSSDDSDLSPVLRRFEAALNTDLDTPTAITVIRRLAEDVLGDKSHRAQRLFRKLAARLGLSLEA